MLTNYHFIREQLGDRAGYFEWDIKRLSETYENNILGLR